MPPGCTRFYFAPRRSRTGTATLARFRRSPGEAGGTSALLSPGDCRGCSAPRPEMTEQSGWKKARQGAGAVSEGTRGVRGAGAAPGRALRLQQGSCLINKPLLLLLGGIR